MCLLVGRRGQRHYRRGPNGSGPKDDDAGTPDCQSGEHYYPHPKARGESDGGSLARSNGIVPGARGDRAGTGQ